MQSAQHEVIYDKLFSDWYTLTRYIDTGINNGNKFLLHATKYNLIIGDHTTEITFITLITFLPMISNIRIDDLVLDKYAFFQLIH